MLLHFLIEIPSMRLMFREMPDRLVTASIPRNKNFEPRHSIKDFKAKCHPVAAVMIQLEAPLRFR
jgi:hypothetical protein